MYQKRERESLGNQTGIQKSKYGGCIHGTSGSCMVAAYMALADHVKDNLKCLDATKSLLTPNANKFHPANAIKDDIGAYLFNDTNLGEIQTVAKDLLEGTMTIA